jgi:hypothetical protein
VRLGLAHHLGWAVAVTASGDHEVVDRRRVELLEADLPAAPVHHVGGPYAMHASGEPLDDRALERLVAEVRTSSVRACHAALAALTADLPEAITLISIRSWPAEFPTDVATQRQVPYESRADSVMYCQVLSDVAADLGWTIHRYDAKDVEAQATRLLGDRADEIFRGPRRRLGPPWSKDHRMALAATVVAAELAG